MSGSGKRTCPVARDILKSLIFTHADGGLRFHRLFVMHQWQHRSDNPQRETAERPVQRRRHRGAIATTAIHERYGTHLSAASRPAPADVHRYVGQGDRDASRSKSGRLTCQHTAGGKRLSPRTRPTREVRARCRGKGSRRRCTGRSRSRLPT
jgi:hypothetical protein